MSKGLLGRGGFIAVLFAALLLSGCPDEPPGIAEPMIDAGGGVDAGVEPGVDAGRRFPDAGAAVNELRFQRLAPDHGPFTGGTEAFVRGSGFIEEAWSFGCEETSTGCGTVSFDGNLVQEADYRFIDDNRIRLIVPAGEPGDAVVELQQGGEVISLSPGYHYDAFYVDPGSGSVSGGTFVTLSGLGTNFGDGDTVTFGTEPCRDVTVVSATRITCRTPPAAAGTVDVTIRRVADGTSAVAEDAYSYYDTADPFGGGLGGGPLAGTINLTVINAGNGNPLPDAYAIVGEDLTTVHQGLTDVSGQITFSGADLVGRQTIHVAKDCFEKTSFVSFDASDVTVFLVPWGFGAPPRCGSPGSPPPPGRGRQGAFISGELIWAGPNEHGPNPWANIPPARADEIKVAYVYTTVRALGQPIPDPGSGGGAYRVLETPLGDLGYPYRIFARPAGLAVYALAGLENTTTGDFIPYVMGVARNVLAGPGEEVLDVDMLMNIPLDHAVDVQLGGLPRRVRAGPDRFRVTAAIDLGGEGIIERVQRRIGFDGRVVFEPIDVVRQGSIERNFRFPAQPALYGALSDGRYSIEAGWYTQDFEDVPWTERDVHGVVDVSGPVLINDFLGIPVPTAPVYGAHLPEDRIIRWSADGPEPDFHMVLIFGGDNMPAWRHLTPGNLREAPIPDLSTIPEIFDITPGVITWAVFAVKIPGFVYDEFSYTYLYDAYWSHSSLDLFTAFH